MAMTDVSPGRLRELLHYNPETGVFTWLVSRCNVRAGAKAGCIRRSRGALAYCAIRIDGRLYCAHRLAWLYMTGEWPPQGVDHRDGDGLNNKWHNLRLANQSQNNANGRRGAANTSGFKGVTFHKRDNRYQAQIQVAGKYYYLGYFATAEAAHAAYAKAAQQQFGEFARVA